MFDFMLAVGFIAAGFTAVVRAVLGQFSLFLLAKKPFSCDLCMSWWGSLLTVGGLAVVGMTPFHRLLDGVHALGLTLGGVTVSLIALKGVDALKRFSEAPRG